MRKLLIAIAVLAASTTAARADVGLGVFVGEPFGVDLKLGLGPRPGLDIVLGATSVRDNRVSYGHVTYLVTPYYGRGDGVRIPIRLGIGGAVYGALDDDTNLAVRVPFELGFRFTRTPIELYGELALVVTLIDENDNNKFADIDGGIGVRFFF